MIGGRGRSARGLIGALMQGLGRRARALFYRPERHYMRGPRPPRGAQDTGRGAGPAPERRG